MVLKPIGKVVAAEKYEALSETYFQDEINEAELMGEETAVEIYKNAQTINLAIAQAYQNVDDGDIEPWVSLQEYVDIVISNTAEIDDSGEEYLLNVLAVNSDTGEVEEPEIDISSMETVTWRTFEVAFTDTNNLVDNGDNTYGLADEDTYLVPNGLAASHAEAAADGEETGDSLIYTPTQCDVSESLKDFDFDNNTLYFAINDLNATIYLIEVTENMIDDGYLTISVPCTGTGTFYSIVKQQEEEPEFVEE